MPKIKEIAAAARRAIVGESVHEALTRRRREAGQQWRDMVAAAADGKAIDIDQLSIVGGLIGVGITKVGATFESDRKAWLEQQDLAKTSAEAAAHAEQANREAAEAQAALEEARLTYERLRQQASASAWAYVSAGHVEASALSHRRANPRLWPADSVLDPTTLAEATAVPDEPDADEREPVPAGSARDDGADWILDGNDD
jgi:hypothetical protein